MKIIEVLLEEVYVTRDHNLEKSRLFIEKRRVLRAFGLECLEECTKCLSSAISILGYAEILPGIYYVVIKLFNRKNFSLEKTMTELWKNLRLGHALCVSPINHKLMRNFSKQWSELCESNEFWKSCIKELNPLVVGFHQIDKEIKQTASDLISNVPISSASMFLHSHHCYKFAGRLISTGRMIEALSYIKEAHRLHGKLLQQKFEYSVTETYDEIAEFFEKSYYDIKTFKENDVMMIKGSCDYEGCVLTPWNVLWCYLESILQVGVVHEILENGSEAEMLLRRGKNVPQFKGLPLFEISFSSVLGKLYCKQKPWCLAEKELTSATKTLVDYHTVIL